MRQYHVIKATGIPAVGPLPASQVLEMFQQSADTSQMLVWWKESPDWVSLAGQIAVIRQEAVAAEQARVAAEAAAAEAKRAAQQAAAPAAGQVRVSRNGQAIGEYHEADIPALLRAKVVLPTDTYLAAGMSAPAPLADLLVKLLTNPPAAPVASAPLMPAPAPKPVNIPVVIPPLRPAPKSGEIVCPNPNCGYVGRPNKIARGSTIIGILLLLCWILPGVIYFMFFSGYRYCCPRCQCQISNDN
jgi:hypothetical protein